MWGSPIWNSGALSPAFGNVITWSTTVGSVVRANIGAAQYVETHRTVQEILTGQRMLGFYGDFYERFHLSTLALDLGNLVSDQTQSLSVWNAYRRSWILNTLTLVNAEGLTVTGQPVPPLQFAPLQERGYTLGISVDGPAQINASISWNFSNGLGVTLAVTGFRIVAWTWPPNWGEGMLERLEWRTDILEAVMGEEQRRSMRIDPRQGLEFSVISQGADRRYMEAVLWNWGARTFAVPLWFDGLSLAAQLTAGATSIPLSTSLRSFVVGELVLLTRDDPRTFEVVEIATIGASIGLARPTQQTWATGTRVYPARSARLTNSANLPRFTGQVSSIRVQFQMTDPMPGTAAATPLYRSIPVLEAVPNWVEDPSILLERKTTVLDAETGLAVVEDEAGIPLTTQRMRYTFPSKASIDTWRQRLYALRGKQGSLWVPTWAEDLIVAAIVSDSATTIDVKWTGYTRYYQTDPNRRDIRMQLRNGTILYRRLTGSSEIDTATERLSIDTPLGVAVNPEDFLLVSFMALSRSDSDTAELSYFAGDVAEAAFAARSFRSVL